MRRIALILFAILIASLGSQRPAAAGPVQQAMSRTSIVSIGAGKPVVLIPGLASPRAVWDGISGDLAKMNRVILVQVNGFGGGAAAENANAGVLDGIVRDVAAYLKQEKIGDAAVVGHSMGGLAGMMLARKHPDLAGKLMIVDALPFYGALMGPGATPETVRPMAERMRGVLIEGPAPTQAPPNMSNTPEGQAKVLEWLKASDKAAVGQAMIEAATTDFTPHLPTLAGRPVTVLYAVPSSERAALSRGLYASAYAGVPSAKLVPVEGSAHFIMLDQPELFADEVRAFLR